MDYNSPIHGLVTRDSSTQATVRTHWGAGFVKAAGILVLQAPYAATKPKARSPMGFLLSGRNTSDCSSGVIFTIGGSLKRRDDASPYRQRVEGQSAGLTQAHEVVWPIFAGCHLQGLQRRPIAIPMPQGDQNPVNSGLGLFCPEPLLPDT